MSSRPPEAAACRGEVKPMERSSMSEPVPRNARTASASPAHTAPVRLGSGGPFAES
jgi:hypothetical protein